MLRISYIELVDYKNTEFGVIQFPSSGTDPKDLAPGADIVGIYGQNGSGKTSVVNSLEIIKGLLSGDGYSISNVRDSYAFGKSQFSLAIGLEYSLGGVVCDILRYDVTFSKDKDAIWVSREKLSGRLTGPVPEKAKPSHRTLIEISQASLTSVPVLSPKGSWRSLLAADSQIKTDLLVNMSVAQRQHYSLIFNHDIYPLLCELNGRAYRSDNDSRSFVYGDFDSINWDAPESAPATFRDAFYDVLNPLLFFIPQIGYHFVSNVGIITTLDHAACSMQLMTVNTDVERYGFGEPPVTLRLYEPAELNDLEYEAVYSSIAGISQVMGSLVPGFSLEVKDLGNRISDAGEEVRRVEFISNRDGIRIPLRCESEGIRKLISLTTALVQVHTKQDAFVAIDELDAGVFEYLLGELLGVIGDFGRGQLLFTAHNLRALETLNARSIVLSTANPKNRFIKFKGHRTTNNLRDQYLRAINLGGQDESVYVPTNKYEIDEALYSAAAQTADLKADDHAGEGQ